MERPASPSGSRAPRASRTAQAPGPDLGPLGLLRVLRDDPIGGMMRGKREYGDVVRFRLGPRSAYLLSHPDFIKYVLQDNNKNFDKRTRGYDALRTLLKDGLLTSEGAFWLRQRRIAQPAFHRDRIQTFATTMTSLTEELLESWRARMKASTPVELDVSQEMMRLTLRIVGLTLFSTDISEDAPEVGAALTVALEHANEDITKILEIPHFIPTPRNLRLKRAVRTLEGLVDRLIAERRGQTAGAPQDLMTMLMQARDEETGEGMSDEQLRYEVMTLAAAGHETTANGLTWSWYLLSKYPDAWRHLREELDAVLGGRTPGIEDLPRLPYTAGVIHESLRLFPPAWVISRSVIADDEIGSYPIRAGSYIFVSPYLVHRDPRWWTDPEGFDPVRFSPDSGVERPRFAYFPFGGGPRQCIGNRFAEMEMQLVLATLAQHVHLELVPGHPVVPTPTITLRPKHGMRMTATPAT